MTPKRLADSNLGSLTVSNNRPNVVPMGQSNKNNFFTLDENNLGIFERRKTEIMNESEHSLDCIDNKQIGNIVSDLKLVMKSPKTICAITRSQTRAEDNFKSIQPLIVPDIKIIINN